MTALATEVVARFGGVVADQLGLRIDDRGVEVFARRAAARGEPPEAYVERLASAADPDELQALVRELTVGETYFFRHREQIDAFAEVVLPERLAARATTRRLAVLSAGCATGEEAYTLAIVARERVPDPAWRIGIDAVDINTASLARAARGHYSRWALRETPAAIERRWFTTEGNEAVLAHEIRDAVRFEPRNLTVDAGWPTHYYDVVFCRNVLMYFTDDQMIAALDRVARALVPGGYLFLGHAESLRGRSELFELCQSHGTFYYQRLPVSARTGSAAHVRNGAIAPEPAASPTAWIDAIQQSSERIQEIAAGARAHQPAGPLAAVAPASLERVHALLRTERYADALAELATLPAALASTPDAGLLRAIVLTHHGDRAAAEVACRELLVRDPTNAGAHYLLAIGRESHGDLIGAHEHARHASELDPSFAMAHVHLGLLARRAGDRDAAGRALGRAIELLAVEDPDRLALYGGGFGRDALVQLCRAELTSTQDGKR